MQEKGFCCNISLNTGMEVKKKLIKGMQIETKTQKKQ